MLSRTSHLADGDDLGFLRIMGRVVAPVTLVVSALLALAIGTRLDVALGIGVMIAAPLDVVSTITGSFELGRRRYAANLVFSWLNYPVFLIGLLVPIPGLDTSRLSHIVGLFCATSVLRSGVATALLVAIIADNVCVRSMGSLGWPEQISPMPGWPAPVRLLRSGRTDWSSPCLLTASIWRVSSYLLAARLVDASFTVSAVVASLRQVARGVERVDWRSMGFRGFVVGWSAMWFGGAIALALLNWPDVGTRWGRLVVAALAASAYLAIFRHVLVALASGPEAKIGRRFVDYLGVTSMGAIAALGSVNLPGCLCR